MQLPGGLIRRGQRQRDYAFAAVTGGLELALADSLSQCPSHPARVTAVLARALDRLGGEPADAESVRALSVGDRQFLMRRLASLLEPGPQWLTARCAACDEPFDLRFEHAELPLKPAGEGYPRVLVETSSGPLWARCPTGADQEALALVEDDGEALDLLLNRLLSIPTQNDSGRPGGDPTRLSDSDRERIEQAVEDLSPEVATHSLSDCPACGAPNQVEISLYACLDRPADRLLREVHTLASNYHWSEQAILDLPYSRRRAYLGLIEQNRGLHDAASFLTNTA